MLNRKIGLRKVAKVIFGKFIKASIRIYQLIVIPLLPTGNCRFQPTCSQYAIDAIDQHGPVLGSWLALKRISRCNPWGGTGVDEVPPKK